MSVQSTLVTVLVKALPQPSKTYGETVCCAGITADGQWKRLFPIRFRHLSGESSFRRWDRIEFRFRRPTSDTRKESCHVFEDSLKIIGRLGSRERSRLLEPLVLGSAQEASDAGHSLALIRPKSSRFHYRRKSSDELEEERSSFRRAARQGSLFDKEIAEIEPSPYEFRFAFEDSAGTHDYRNGDWEAHAMFFRERLSKGEAAALRWMEAVFNDDYPRRGMVFALGNMAKRPQTWQLLGVIRLDEPVQGELLL